MVMLARASVALGLIGASCGTALADALADRPEPFAIRDQNPFIQIYGLPPLDPGDVTPPHRTRSQILFDLANNSRLAEGTNESISLDGETYRLALSVRHGVSDRLEVGAEIPLVFHRGGVLDDFIEGWHDFLGLSNSERDETPNNALDYSYRVEGQELVAVRSGQQGLGDIRLFAATPLYRADEGGLAVSLRGSLELPTGDSARLLGSGSTDIALSVNAVERGLGSSRVTGYGQLGVLAVSDGDVLAAQQRHWVAFGGVGLGWRVWDRIDLKAQLDGHGSFYRSELPQLGSRSIQLTLGGTIRFGRATALDLAIGENLFTDTIPDLLIHVAVSHRN
jgi:hypothetical protein